MRDTVQSILYFGAAAVFIMVSISFVLPLMTVIVPIFGIIPNESLCILIRIAVFTFGQAFFSAFFASLLGFVTAFFYARRNFFGRQLLGLLPAVPLSIPPVVIALAFILWLGKNGICNQLLYAITSGKYSLGTFLYTMQGVLLIHTFYNFPIALRTITTVWEHLPEKNEYAAALLGASSSRIFRTIIFPSLLPPFCAAFLIIFLYCFFSFVIILLLGGLGVSTLEVALYRVLRAENTSLKATWIACIETGIAITVVWLHSRIHKTYMQKDEMLYARKRIHIGTGTERFFFLLCMAAIIFFFSIASYFTIFAFTSYKGHAPTQFFRSTDI